MGWRIKFQLIVFTSKALLRHPLAKSAMAEMGPQTRFQRLIPEVLHPSPLRVSQPTTEATKAASALAQSKKKGSTNAMTTPSENVDDYLSGNNSEPRIPYSLIPENNTDSFRLLPPSQIKTVIFCSGQVYYLLYKTRAANNLGHIAIARVEQLSPLPMWEMKDVMDSYPNLEEVVWCQEEHMNGGAWTFMEPRLETVIRETLWWKSGKAQAAQIQFDSNRVSGGLSNLLFPVDKSIKEATSFRGGRLVRYAGRCQSAAPATGALNSLHFLLNDEGRKNSYFLSCELRFLMNVSILNSLFV